MPSTQRLEASSAEKICQLWAHSIVDGIVCRWYQLGPTSDINCGFGLARSIALDDSEPESQHPCSRPPGDIENTGEESTRGLPNENGSRHGKALNGMLCHMPEVKATDVSQVHLLSAEGEEI